MEELMEILAAGDVDQIIKTADEGFVAPSPVLLQESSCSSSSLKVLRVEDISIEVGADFLGAMLLWLVAFPVFNQPLPRGPARNFWAVLYRYAMGIEGGPKAAMKTVQAIGKLINSD